MKSKISLAFEKCKKEKRPALITYTVAGDNTKMNSLKILNTISKYADILELGFPHNTPVADGGQIQESSHRALKNGIKLKDVYEIFTPFTVTVSLSDKDITVTQGIYTKRLDCLKLDTIENVELITTALGRCKNYGTLDLYSYGSAIRIPNVKDYMKIKADIESRIEACKHNKEQ